MNGTHQVLAYADDVNLIGNDIRIERNPDVLLNVCKYIDLAVNTGKTKFMKVKHQGMMGNEHITAGKNVKTIYIFRLFIDIFKILLTMRNFIVCTFHLI